MFVSQLILFHCFLFIAHSGNAKIPCSRNILHIFSVWVPLNCNSNKCRRQNPSSKLHQFPYNNLLLFVRARFLFLKSIFTISYNIYRAQEHTIKHITFHPKINLMLSWIMQQYLNPGRFFSELCLQAVIHGFINAIISTEV